MPKLSRSLITLITCYKIAIERKQSLTNLARAMDIPRGQLKRRIDDLKETFRRCGKEFPSLRDDLEFPPLCQELLNARDENKRAGFGEFEVEIQKHNNPQVSDWRVIIEQIRGTKVFVDNIECIVKVDYARSGELNTVLKAVPTKLGRAMLMLKFDKTEDYRWDITEIPGEILAQCEFGVFHHNGKEFTPDEGEIVSVF